MIRYETILFSVENRVATISLNRPNDANGLNLQLASELADVANVVAGDADLKAVVLTGEGSFFCAGGDVKSMFRAANTDPGAEVKALADQLHTAISTFATMGNPLICAVNGTAAGAGFSLAMSADMVLAAKSAKFTMAYSNVGLSPDGSSSYFLPRLVGLRKTQELMLTNKVLSAQEAEQWGLINHAVEDDALAEATAHLAAKFVAGSRASNAAIKKLLLASSVHSLEEQMALESQTISDCANGHDGREGVAAFINKRKPEFS